MYLAKGTLPWKNLKAKNKQNKYKKIMEIKDSYSNEALCVDLPGILYFTTFLDEFSKYLNLVKRLEFEEKPDYPMYRNLFLQLLER